MKAAMAFDLEHALHYLIASEGSDLHLKVPAHPLIRRHGTLEPIQGSSRLAPADTDRVLREMLLDPAQAARVRHRQRGRLLLLGRGPRALPRERLPPEGLRVARAARDPRRDQVGRRAHAPAGHHAARRGGARDHPAHRHDRLGQVDDARGDARPHEPDDAQAHRHDRGPDRVPAPGPAVDRQPARGGSGHRVVQARAAPRPAPGPRRDPDRRDARRGDGAHRAVGRRDRAPRPLDAAHRRRRRVDQPHHRLLPDPPAAAGAGDDRRHA